MQGIWVGEYTADMRYLHSSVEEVERQKDNIMFEAKNNRDNWS